MPSSPPIILTIAGSDSCAGAGIQADLKAIDANCGYGICAVTAIVSEVPGQVSRIQEVEPEMLADQLRLLGEHYLIAAIKTGMLANRELTQVVVNFLQENARDIPLVVDPVMVATSGDRLLDDEAIELYRTQLLPMATIATPNLAEAAVLLDQKQKITMAEQMPDLASAFYQRFGCGTLLKGGHLSDDQLAVDFYQGKDYTNRMRSERTLGIDTHGTGCTFSAALATLLGGGLEISQALAHSKIYITDAIAQSHHWPEPGNIHALNHWPENVA